MTLTSAGAGYLVAKTSGSDTVFTIERTATGFYLRTCSAPATGGCDASGSW